MLMPIIMYHCQCYFPAIGKLCSVCTSFLSVPLKFFAEIVFEDDSEREEKMEKENLLSYDKVLPFETPSI